MPNLRDIQKRITSVQGTRQITRTMEMVATAKIRKAQERIEAAAPYSDSMMEVLGSVAGDAGGIQHPLLEVHEGRERVIAIVAVSDRGLAGGFNGNILRMAERFIAAEKELGVTVDLITVGKKAHQYFSYRGVQPIASYSGASDKPTFALAKEIATIVSNAYAKGEADEVAIMYNRFKNVAEQIPTSTVILPIASESISEAAEEVDEAKAGYVYEPSAPVVLARLLPTYLETMIFRSLLDSAAAEQGARRRAMKSATDNATEMIGTLTRSYNRARQAAITTEIAEIVGGAAALED